MLRSTVIVSGAACAALSFGRLAVSAAQPRKAKVSAAEALTRLRAGNARFVTGALIHQNGVTERRVALAGHQAPYASILSCSDSRVPPELIFDATVGDLFVVRNAGNFVTPSVLGTLEYGYGALGIELIVVLGHEACGAVSATYGALRDHEPLPKNLDVVESAIAPGIASVVREHGSLHAAILANARAQAAKLRESPVLGPAIRNGALTVVCADYGFATGAVTVLT